MSNCLAWEAKGCWSLRPKAANSRLDKAEVSLQPVLSYVNEDHETIANWKIKKLHSLARSNREIKNLWTAWR